LTISKSEQTPTTAKILIEQKQFKIKIC